MSDPINDGFDPDAPYPLFNKRNSKRVERYLLLIEEHRGNVSAIARDECISRSVCKQYIDKVPELAAALDDIRQTVVDAAEKNIFAATESGDLPCSKMVVAMLGKDRGWVPREEKTGADGAPLIPPSITFAPYEEEPEAPAQGAGEPQESSAND